MCIKEKIRNVQFTNSARQWKKENGEQTERVPEIFRTEKINDIFFFIPTKADINTSINITDIMLSTIKM